MMSNNLKWDLETDVQEQSILKGFESVRITPKQHSRAPQENAIRSASPPIASNGTTATTEEDDIPEKEIGKAEESLMKKILRTKLVDNKNNLEVLRKDPNSPLYCVKTFEELSLKPELLKGVYAMGFTLPSKIQETALPTLLANPPQNMIAQSQSGTGKTAAFLLACLSRIDPSKNYPQVLILSPTYELAMQTGAVGQKMAQFCPNIRFCFAVRGNDIARGEKVMDHVVIGTPGKILDWGNRLQVLDLSKIICFVLDEADVMIDTQGHHDQSIRIHKKLDHSKCQMMFFSATYTKEVMDFAEIIVPNPIILRLKREDESLDYIKQYYIECQDVEDKLRALFNIYGMITIGQSIIFCHTRKTASWVVERMVREGHSVGLLSGDLNVDQRIAVLNRFREGKERVLITTNVCARGIDVEQVTVVANFDLPQKQDGHADCETYLHRIGRTGRFGKPGLAINMVDGPKSRRLLEEIQEHFGRPIHKLDAEDEEELTKLSAD